MKTLFIVICILVSAALLPGQSQNHSTYKHPTLDFQFTASEGWKKVDHPEDKMILEMANPDDDVHVILWFTETENSAENYLEKMADMKGFSWNKDPAKITIKSREAWIINAEGKIQDNPSKIFLVSLPLTGEKYVHHKNHIAQYIVMIWCPSNLSPDKQAEMNAILQSIEIQ